MANIALLRNAMLSAAVSGGSYAAGLPAAHVLDQQPKRVARSTDLLAASTTLTFDLGQPVMMSMFALIATNLSKSATWRIRVSNASDMSSPLLDVTRPGRQPDTVWGSLPWGAFPWDGYSGKTPPGGIISFYLHPTAVVGRYVRFDILDADNPAGYVEIGHAMAGEAFSPKINMSFGVELGVVDESRRSRSIGGQSYTDRKPPRRRLSCSFDALTQAEAMGQIYDYLLEVGLGGSLLVVYDSNDNVAVLPRRTFFGEMTDLPPIVEANPSSHPHTWRFVAEERI